MKTLKEILLNVPVLQLVHNADVSIHQITFDSRQVAKGTLFFAVKGTVVDGHQFISTAIQNGAEVIVCQDLPSELVNDVVYVQVEDTNFALAHIANNFYGAASKELKLVGVTGTNGKTTIASLLFQMFTNLGYKVGLLSTVKIMVGDDVYPATHTTPDSITINKYLRKMVEEGCEYCFMEVSSHGIAQKRTEALYFRGGIFTNLTHDHLDYHKTFAEYRNVKKLFFDDLPKESFAITNADDKNGMFMLQNTSAKKITYGLKNVADVQVRLLEKQLNGMLMQINHSELWVQLIGDFNASNLAAIYATAISLGIPQEEVLLEMSKLQSVSGRFQYFVSEGKVTAIVDYAHTPDALENVLKTIEQLRTRNEQLITVVGCGGDRDKTKRPEMAQIATSMSTLTILTSDNPRTENPEVILDDMEAGVEPQNTNKYLRISDRSQAIKTACKMAQSGDIILVAGKGHETYQEINGVRHHFDDLEELKKHL